ncbi:HAMP domain-containing sensor histidine kinase [Rugamonas sp.]|uniref:sensor histidine kinase n=1 Tax=Rugamonas sp. TaxID=1926287 RepID=UPI0025FB1BA8|nr:HAMP domain-containing sensor histidine kinase [Rugamonas sp.]
MNLGSRLPAGRWRRLPTLAWTTLAWPTWPARQPRPAHATTRVKTLCLIGAAANPLCYLVWHRLWPETYESLPLRAVAVALCLASVGAQRFSRRGLRLYQIVVFSYALSFFFTFMCLMNHASPVSAEALLVSLIVLFHFNMGIATLSYLIGTTLACLAVAALGHAELLLSKAVLQQLPVHCFAIAALSATKVSRNALERERLAGLGAGLATVAHELRTPLVSIDANVRGLVRVLSAPAARPEERGATLDALNRIQFEARHMNHMVDLFLLSATAVNRNLRPTETVSMAAVVDAVLRRYPFTGGTPPHAVAVDVKHDFHYAGQQELSVVILLNLLRNALKAVQRAGKGRVRIVVDGARATPRLLVIDTGCGVATAHLPLIFQRFFTHPPQHGTGIGLALCRDIMQAWNARIRCVSREAAYAIFVLEFPKPKTISGEPCNFPSTAIPR